MVGPDSPVAVGVGPDGLWAGTALPHDSVNRAGFLTTLSTALRIGDLDVLREGRQIALEAVHADPPVETDRPTFLVNHATLSHLWFVATGDTTALDEAVAGTRAAIAAIRDDSAGYATVLAGHVTNLQAAFEHHGDPALLDEAITTSRSAVHWMADEHWMKAGCFANLALLLRLRFQHSGELGALEAAIAVARRAVGSGAPNDPDTGIYLSALASSLHLRYLRLAHTNDID